MTSILAMRCTHGIRKAERKMEARFAQQCPLTGWEIGRTFQGSSPESSLLRSGRDSSSKVQDKSLQLDSTRITKEAGFGSLFQCSGQRV